MSDYPTMEITIKLEFTPCESGLQYQITSSCFTRVNNGEEIRGKSGPMRDFMHADGRQVAAGRAGVLAVEIGGEEDQPIIFHTVIHV